MVHAMVFFLICRHCKYALDKGYLTLTFCLENWFRVVAYHFLWALYTISSTKWGSLSPSGQMAETVS